MMKLLDAVADRLRSFVGQRDDVALILWSPAADSLPVLKIVEGLEEESTSDLYWTVTDDFVEPASYARAAVAAFAARHAVVRLAMRERGMDAWPPIPARVRAPDTPPAERLRELAAFSRELLPAGARGSNVWVFYPLHVADHGAFAALMADVLRHEFPFPWCHGLRFVVRADPAAAPFPTLFGRRPRVQWYQPDLGIDAINRSLEEAAGDESLPLDERVAVVPIMAGTDFAWGRYPEALAKYELLLRYHASTGNYAMAAFALNGIGEVYEKLGDLERANASYEAALVPASEGQYPAIPVWLNTVVNLGNLCMRQGRWADGEAYHDVAQQLATVARNPTSKVSALGSRGDCQHRQGKLAEAAQSWRAGAAIAAQLADVAACRALVGRLEALYAQTGQWAEAHELREQLDALNTPAGAAA